MQRQHFAGRAFALALLTVLTAAAFAQDGKVKAGPWARERIPEGWVVHNTKNYHVQSECGIEKAKRLGEHMEAMNKTYRSLFKPEKEGEKAQTIKLMKDRESFLRYGAPPSAAAYYSPTEREMVCYDTGKWMDEAKAPEPVAAPITGPAPEQGSPEEAAAKLQKAKEARERRMRKQEDLWKMDLLGCAAHEGWHQYFHWYVTSMVVLPSWVNEGMGDYFYTAVPKQKLGQKRVPAALGGTFGGRLMIAKAALRQKRFVPASELITYSKAQYYSNPSICYAEGWCLCQFLLHGGNPKYAKLVPAFIKLVRDDTNMPAVTGKTFKGIDLAKLDAEFEAWVEAQKLPDEEAAEDDDPFGLSEDGGDEGGSDAGGDGGDDGGH